MVPGTLVIIGMGFVCIFRISYVSIVSHFENLSVHPLITSMSHETIISINMLPFHY